MQHDPKPSSVSTAREDRQVAGGDLTSLGSELHGSDPWLLENNYPMLPAVDHTHMEHTMDIKSAPKFFIEVRGLKYGARPLTITEQALASAEAESLTNGNFTKWLSDPTMAGVAMLVSVGAQLNRAIVTWPAEIERIDFLKSDDPDMIYDYWEAFNEELKRFRRPESHKDESTSLG